jgi:hypothetical protein
VPTSSAPKSLPEPLSLSSEGRPARGRGIKLSNEYQRYVADIDAPKAVWMAIAASFALRIMGGEIGVHDLIRGEWDALHANGIVPQKPPKVVSRG